MSQEIETIYKIMIDFVREGSEVEKIIHLKNTEPEPEGEYASVFLRRIKTEKSSPDPDKLLAVSCSFEIRFCRGDDPMDRAIRLLKFQNGSRGRKFMHSRRCIIKMDEAETDGSHEPMVVMDGSLDVYLPIPVDPVATIAVPELSAGPLKQEGTEAGIGNRQI